MRVGAKVLSANSFAKTICRNDFAELRGAKRGQTDAAGGVQVRQEGGFDSTPWFGDGVFGAGNAHQTQYLSSDTNTPVHFNLANL